MPPQRPAAPWAAAGARGRTPEPGRPRAIVYNAALVFSSRMARSPTSSSKSAPEGDNAPAAPQPESFEDALAELDRLVEQMERGQLPLDRLLDGYRRGAELLGYCRQRLQAVEQQVKVLEDGQLKPWSAT